MSKTNAWENALLLLVFNNVDAANIGDAGGLQNSAAAGSLYLSLHTADPGEGGSQTTSEAAYTGYARVAVSRNGSAGFTVTGNSVSPTADVLFPVGSAGGGTATHVGIGTASSGTGFLMYKGTLTPNITMGAGIAPRVTTATALTEE